MRNAFSMFRAGQQGGEGASGVERQSESMCIAIGDIPPALAAEGTELIVDIRGRPLPVRVVPRPFYKRPKATEERNA